MKRILYSLVCSLIYFIVLVSTVHFLNDHDEPSFIRYSYITFLVYAFFFTYWIYFLLAYIYLWWAEKNNRKISQLIKAIVLSYSGFLIKELIQIRDYSYTAPSIDQYILFLVFGVFLFLVARVLYLGKLKIQDQ